MIDSHCHLTYEQLYSRLDDVLSRADADGVGRIITIGTSVADAQRAIALCRAHEHIRCAVGIHPHHSGEATADDLEALKELEKDPMVLALGEMGLDYHYDFSPRVRQHEVFIAQLQLAQRTGRPIVIHCREAVDDCLAILNDFSAVPALFHCFTGSRDEATRLLDRGYLLGFTGVVTYKKSDELREIAAMAPSERIVVETDAPYLAPEPVRKHKNNEPAFVMHTARLIAKLRNMGIGEFDRLTTANVSRHFGWP